MGIGIETLQTLIFVGAFRFTGKPKGELVILARMMELEEGPNKGPLIAGGTGTGLRLSPDGAQYL